jgi:GNAT superfamily N-acetyltransferase
VAYIAPRTDIIAWMRTDRVIIRKARESDILGLAETHVASWRAAYRGLMPDKIIEKHTVESRSVAWTKTLVDPTQRILVCISDERVAGFSYFGRSREKHAEPTEAELMAIYVHPDYWRRGIGRAICRETIENLRGNFSTVIVWVLRDNHNTRKFYEAMDFKLIEGMEKQLPWFGNVPEVCYRREL